MQEIVSNFVRKREPSSIVRLMFVNQYFVFFVVIAMIAT